MKVKHIALYKLFPKLVNLSLPFVACEHSDYFMRILIRGCKIEWGGEKAKIDHFKPHLDLAIDLLRSGGLKLSEHTMSGERIKNFKRVLLTFKRCYLEVSEVMKRQILSTMLQYITLLNEQVISQIENGTELLDGTDFLQSVTHNLIEMLKDYYDSVRDHACQLLEYMMTHMLRRSPIGSDTTKQLLQMLRTSVNIGIPEQLQGPTRDAAQSEAEYIGYMFKDAQEFLKLMITAMMDEPSTRESITRVILKLNL